MNKKVISIIVSLVFVLGLAAVSSAANWAEIIYGGYVSVAAQAPVRVLADTGIWVFNPNTSAITCMISHVVDGHGTVMFTNQLLYDPSSNPLTSIPSGGHGWTTLGLILTQSPPPGPGPGTYKLTYRIVCSGTPARVPVVEVKEVIYFTDQLIVPGTTNPIWYPNLIRTWTEAALGGPFGTGKY